MLEVFKKMNKAQQEKTLRKWAEAYYNDDAPLVTDAVYDMCYNEYKSKYGEFDYLGEPDSAFKKFEHPIPVTSLEKVNTYEDYEKMCNKLENNVIIEPKYDGLTVVYYPDGTMVSRGNGTVGEILPFANRIPNLPKTDENSFDWPVRMEVMINKPTFDRYYGNSAKTPRNLAAGILRRRTYTEDIENLTYVAYNFVGCDLPQSSQLVILAAAGFNTTPLASKADFDNLGHKLNAKEQFDKALKMMEEVNKIYPTDGMVIKYDGENASKFGKTAHHPCDMFAYKFKSKEKETIIRDIVWSMGRGKLTPVAVFDPIELNGAQVQKASVHNISIMNKLGLKIGAEVKVTLKNEIIPQIVESNCLGEDIIIPNKCPYCGSPTTINDSMELCCDNPNCGILFSNAMKLVSKKGLDIEGFSEKTIQRILDYLSEKCPNFNALDILRLDVDDFLKMDFTPYMSEKLSGNIAKSKNNVPFTKFLASLDIPLLGTTASEKLEEAYGGDIAKMLNDFESEPCGTHSTLGPALIASIKANTDRIVAGSLAISIKEPEIKESCKEVGYNVAITGKLSMSRDDFALWLSEHHCKFHPTLTKKCDYLVTNEDDPNSSKAVKAKKYGVEIISEADFVNKIKGEENE